MMYKKGVIQLKREAKRMIKSRAHYIDSRCCKHPLAHCIFDPVPFVCEPFKRAREGLMMIREQ